MALHWQAVVLLLLHLHGGVFVNTSPIAPEDHAEDLYTQYRPQIWSVIDNLNANPDRLYNYDFSHLVDAQKKTDDVTFIEIEVAAECFAYTGCPNAVFTCKGYVEHFTKSNSFETLPGIDCQHKAQVQRIEEAQPVFTETSTASKEQTNAPSVQKSEYCPGCTVDLDTNVPGVENLISTALHHLEAEKTRRHVSVRVLRLQREIVSGVKFILLLEVAPTVCDAHVIDNPPMCPIDSQAATEICRIEYIQKPWISDDKHIIGNNCTTSQDFAAVAPKKTRNDFDNEIDVNNEYKKSAEMPEAVPESPNYEKMAETGNLEPEVSPARLLELDAQIIPTDPTEHQSAGRLDVETTKFGMDNSQMAVEDVPSLPTSTDSGYTTLTAESAKPVKDVDSSESSQSQESTESTEAVEERTKRQTTTTDASSSSSEESDEVKLKPKVTDGTPVAQVEPQPVPEQAATDEAVQVRRKRSDDDNSSSSSSDSDEKHKKRKTKKYQPEEKNCNDNDDDQTNDCRYQKTKAVKKPACNDDDDDENNDCPKMAKQPSKKCKKNKKDSSSSSSSSDDDDDDNDCQGRKRRDLSEYVAEQELVNELAKFAGESLDDERWRHEVLDVIRVKKLELEGAVYHMVVRFATTKCNEIGECFPNEYDKLCKLMIHYANNHAKLLKSRCHKIERDVDKNRSTHRNKRGMPGAPSDATSDPEMLNLAKQTLIQLDSKSSHDNKYKVVKIHSATKQVVSGVLYKLKVDIIESDCSKSDDKDSALCGEKKEAAVKTCHISIWDQPWLPQGKKTDITCDEEQHSFRSKRAITPSEYQSRRAFYSFKENHKKIYATPEEENYRFEIFMSNMKKARELQENEMGTAVYGASRFADMHPAEFKAYLGYRPELRQENAIPMAPAKIPDIELPTEYDWRTKGAVTHVKDQGQCGSCWAFSVTGNVEGQYAIKHSKLLEFSEQELVDCDTMDEGCNGGLMDNAYRAIEKMGGLELESAYPYDAEDEKCKFQPSLARVQLSGAVNVSQNEDDMAKFLVKNGPISIAINANAMQLYMGGVSHPLKFLCDPSSLDHGVLIVGYGVHKYKLFNKTLPYWTVKNSWGPGWGEQGYYRVYRGDGTCGVNKMASSAIVE